MPRDPLYMKLVAPSKLVISGIFFAIFVGYSPWFLRSGRISMPRDPRSMTIAASSKVMISVIFGRFRGL